MSNRYGQGGIESGTPIYGAGGLRVGTPIYGNGGAGDLIPGGLSSIPFKLAESSIIAITQDIGTFTRATTATVEDFEGVIREVLSGEVRYQGQRRVANGYNSGDSSEDLTTLTNTPTANDIVTATTVELTGTNNSYSYFQAPISYPVGTNIVVRVKAQWISGATGVGFKVYQQGGAVADQVISDLSDEAEKIISLNLVVTSAGVITFGVDNRTAAIAGVDTAPTKILFTELQIQDKTGASDPTVPDSYVSTGILSTPYHGANVDGVKYFLTDNGNSVASNVVTEAAGSIITTGIGYFGEPARTNNLLYARDFTDAAWVKTNITPALDAIGIDGLADSASSLTSTAGNGTVFQSVTLGSAARTSSFHVRRKTGTGIIEYTDDGGSTYTDITSSINSSTYTRFEITTTQANPDIGFRITTSGDAIEADICQIEGGNFATSPIPTIASSVTRNADVLSYLTTYIPVNDCAGKLKWTPTAVGQGTIYLKGAGDATDSLQFIHDGTNIVVRKRLSSTNYDATKALTYVADTTYIIKWRLSSTDGIDVWIEDVKGTGHANTADASVGSAMYIGSDHAGASPQTGGIDEFTEYSGVFTDAEMAAL